MNGLRRLFLALRQRVCNLRRRNDGEDEQLLGRALICVITTGAYALAPVPPTIGLMVGTICFSLGLFSACLLLVVTQSPPEKPSPRRRWTMMMADILALTAILYLGGQYAALFWGALLWVPLDFGFRYGSTYLKVAVPLSILGFTLTLLGSDSFWRESIWLWMSMTLVLAIIPLAVLRQAKATEAMSAAVQKTVRERTKLLGHLTATLQVPLGGILRASEAIQDAPEQALSLAKVAALSARHLLLLTQDIIDSAAIEAGELHRDDFAFDIREVCSESLASLMAAAEAKNVIFQVEVASAVPALIYTDLPHVRQILVYCFAGVLVSATATVSVRISTRTVGAINQLFIEIWTTEATLLAAPPYLAITAAPALIEFLGGESGTINDGDKVGRWVALPFQAIASPPSEPFTDAASNNIVAFTDIFIRHRSAVPSLRVLVIDDQLSARLLLERILSKAGHVVTTAATGEDGLDALESAQDGGEPFAAILLDLHLPDQAGTRMIQLVNYMELGKRTPLIIITADRSDAALAACRGAGVTAFLTKPVKPALLLDALAFAASDRRTDSAAPPRKARSLPPLISNFDGQATPEILQRCLLDASTALDRVRDAALSMDWPQATEHAYSVYAVAVNTGDAHLVDAASRLHELSLPAFNAYWVERVEAVQVAIDALREVP